MGSNSINAARQAALAKVQSGEWNASQAYAADRSGAFSRGMFEPIEAQAKAGGMGQWAGASQATRQHAASFTPSQRQASQATQRARAAGINPFGYSGATDASGRAVDNRPAGGMLLPGSKASGYNLMGEGMPSHFSPEMVKRLGAVAPQGYSALDASWGQDYGPTPGDAAISREQAAEQDRTGSLNSPATYRTASGGVVDPTLDQRARFNPNTNPNYRPPVDSTPMNGANNNAVGKLTPPPLPTKSNYAGVQNRFDETYTGRLVAGAKERAARAYQQRESEIRQRLGSMGATAASAPGLEQQLLTEASQGYNRDFGDYEREAQTQAAQLASDFDMQRAGALDAFDMNKGNLSLGYSADARAGALLPGQVTAQTLGNQAQGLQNQFSERTLGDRIAGVTADLYSRNLENQYGEATMGDRVKLVSSEVNAAGIRNDRAMFELDQTKQVAPLQQQAAALELVRLQQAITLAKQAGDIAMAEGLGKVAGKVAAAGGFRWIGAGVGAAVGSIIPGAGTIAGGSLGLSIGQFLDSMLAPQQSAGK